MPNSSGVYSRTPWKYWVIRNRKPNIEKYPVAMARAGSENRRIRNRRMSRIGAAVRASHHTNAASRATPRVPVPSVVTESQP
ncbi:Uncharacterised protein [Mycobacteroides abscessus subsp. abscessus]|nr:Uncharacterised protein [Mycobacteroides abscessus subsp. abscessus]